MKNHQAGSRMLDGLPPDALCRCGKNLKSAEAMPCPLDDAIPPHAGEKLCRCCPACRRKCHDEV
jgi:hypothetical protein